MTHFDASAAGRRTTYREMPTNKEESPYNKMELNSLACAAMGQKTGEFALPC